MRVVVDAGVTKWIYRDTFEKANVGKNTEAIAIPEAKRIEAPRPDDLRSLMIWAHECGHVATWRELAKPLPEYVYEYEASVGESRQCSDTVCRRQTN